MNNNGLKRLLQALFKDNPITDAEILESRGVGSGGSVNANPVFISLSHLDAENSHLYEEFSALLNNKVRETIYESDLHNMEMHLIKEVESFLRNQKRYNKDKTITNFKEVLQGILEGKPLTDLSKSLSISAVRVGQIVKKLRTFPPVKRLRDEL